MAERYVHIVEVTGSSPVPSTLIMNTPIPFQFLIWYLWEAPRSIIKAWGNFLRFGLQFFSIPLLFKTFFAPWRGYQWSYGRGFDFSTYFEVFFSNLITRILGAFMRLILLVFGLLTEAVFLVGGLAVLIGWFVLPLITLRLLFLSIGV